MEMEDLIVAKHREVFGLESSCETRLFFAPGRVNLIGEHTDYNGGHVFPCALTIGTYAVVSVNREHVLRLYSENFSKEGIRTFEIGEPLYHEANGWCNYVLGVVDQLRKRGHGITVGLDITISGNIPNGAGLSSSASLELVTATLLNTMFQWSLPKLELVKLCQKAENEFIGVACGIMDQFAIGMGEKNAAILLDTARLTYKLAPIVLEHHQIVIANTNKRRGLADSKYNQRRGECERALEALKGSVEIQTLGDLSIEQFERVKGQIKEPVCVRRAKHAVYENARTLEAYEALSAHDLLRFGALMNASHRSLRDDYEVSCQELDVLVELAWSHPGVLGARMTGAGFGGCTVNLVENEQVASFIEDVGSLYYKSTGLRADFYTASVGDGAREVQR